MRIFNRFHGTQIKRLVVVLTGAFVIGISVGSIKMPVAHADEDERGFIAITFTRVVFDGGGAWQPPDREGQTNCFRIQASERFPRFALIQGGGAPNVWQATHGLGTEVVTICGNTAYFSGSDFDEVDVLRR